MSRKLHGQPFSKRHVRRLIAAKRTVVIKNLNDRFFQYLDSAANEVLDIHNVNKETGENSTKINECIENINFAAYLNILSSKDNENTSRCIKAESDLLDKDAMQLNCSDLNKEIRHNTNQLSQIVFEQQENQVREQSTDFFLQLLQNIDDYEESSDDDSNDSIDSDSTSENDEENKKFLILMGFFD